MWETRHELGKHCADLGNMGRMWVILHGLGKHNANLRNITRTLGTWGKLRGHMAAAGNKGWDLENNTRTWETLPRLKE